MITSIIAWLAKLGASGIVNRAITLIEKRGEQANESDKIKADLTAEYLRQVVEETRIIADYNKAKLSVPWFWLFAGLFIVPLAIWWVAICLYQMLWCADCIYAQSWTIAGFPSPLDQWAGDMVRWLFYVGSGVAGLKTVLKQAGRGGNDG